MRALLDVNVLIALLDDEHTSHRVAWAWFSENAKDGWASCPITQNGCVRILSNPGYPNVRSVTEVVERLRDASADPSHEFWSDSFSMLDETIVDPTRVHGSKQLTDVYLLALAVRNDGRLVTFDAGISLSAVRGAKGRNLVQM
ncbi:MAG: TA system VapC family ribonuclease toxin [Gemmatimonadaceae bacterium]